MVCMVEDQNSKGELDVFTNEGKLSIATRGACNKCGHPINFTRKTLSCSAGTGSSFNTRSHARETGHCPV